MIDRYTKAVLTVIAASLTAIAIEQAIPAAHAQSAGCTGSSNGPCYVTPYPGLPFKVVVVSK